MTLVNHDDSEQAFFYNGTFRLSYNLSHSYMHVLHYDSINVFVVFFSDQGLHSKLIPHRPTLIIPMFTFL